MSALAPRATRLLPALLVIGGALLAWAVLPTAPNYDTATHLIWARELLDGAAPAVDAPASPTPHPLWLLAAIVASATGGGASLLQLVALLAYGVVVVAVWRLARSLAGPVAAAAAALVTLSSFALLLSAYKAYADLPFLALVLSGLLAEQRRRAQGGGTWTMPALLGLAGLLRPEAWAFGLLLLALRLIDGERRRALLGPTILLLAAPLLWALADLLLTGDPLHSLTGTQALAEELGRRTGALAGPVELLRQLADLLRPPVFLAGLFGVAGAIWLAGWRPLLLLLAPLGAGALGFLVLGVLGLPLLQRYLLLPGMLLAVFAGVGIAILVEAATGGALPTQPGPVTVDVPALTGPVLRRVAGAALVLGVIGTGGYLVLKADSFAALGRGVLREARWQRQATQVVRSEAVQRRLADGCGPISLPTYRLIPELLLRADLPVGSVVSRARELGGVGQRPTGIALVIVGDRAARERMGWAAGVPRSTNAIPPGFIPIGQLGPILATARCR